MRNPWDNDPIVGSAGPVYGAPRLPSPQTDPQAQKDVLDVIRTQQQIGQVPLQNQHTQAEIQQTKTQIKNTGFDNVNNLRKQFESEQPVQDYKTVIPLMDSAIKAQNNKAGDLNIVYAFGKVMDPNSVVREGEQVMATNVGGISEKVKGYIDQINGQGQLTPPQRAALLEEIRNRARTLQQTYNQRRAFYEDFAQRNGVNPQDVVGPHPGQPFQQDEAAYIRAHGGTPKPSDGPSVTAAPTEQGFDKAADPRLTELNPAQAEAYDAWWKAHPDPTPDQLRAFGSSLGITIGNAEKIIEAKKKSGSISHDLQYQPDITDVRGGSGFGEKLDAGIRGAADVASFGLADKIAAAGDTLVNPDTSFGQNLARQYAISDYDTQNHFPSRTVGQVAGGFAVPMGEVSSLPQLALKGAGVGAAYGAGSSRSFADVPQNALLGGFAGALIPTALVGAGRGVGAAARGFRRAPGEIPPLVDPATGELNQPMDAMRPADRVAAMRGYGMENISPGMAGGRSARIGDQVLNNMPGSAGVMEDFNSAVSRDLRRSMQGVAQQAGTSKTLNEGGAELQRGTKEWMTRFDAVTNKAYNAIPIKPTAPATNKATLSVLQDLTGKLQSNPQLAEEIKDPILGRYLIAIQKDGLNWQDTKDFRTYIGNKIGQFRFSEDARTGDYRALYGALSEDMRASAAAQGPKALRAFERANSIKAAGERRIEESLVRILGPDAKGSPEKAADAVRSMTKGGKSTGDLRRLAQVKASTVKSGAWDEIASTMIHLGGQPAASEGRAFNPQTFVQWYSDMAEPARRMLFKPELRKSLDGLVAMNQQVSKVRALSNTSQTAPNLAGIGFASALGSSAVAGFVNPMAWLGIPITLGTGAVDYGAAKLWTSPKFVNIITGYGRAAAKGDQNATKSQIGRLTKLAATNPELRVPIENLLKNLANDNAIPALAASPNPGPDQNQQ